METFVQYLIIILAIIFFVAMQVVRKKLIRYYSKRPSLGMLEYAISDALKGQGYPKSEFEFEITEDIGPFPKVDIDVGTLMLDCGGHIPTSKTIYCKVSVNDNGKQDLFHVKIHSTRDTVRRIKIKKVYHIVAEGQA